MKRDHSSIAERISGNGKAIEDSITILEAQSVLTYIYSVVSKKLFEGQLNSSERSEYLAGAWQAMEELSYLAEGIRQLNAREGVSSMLIE